MCVVMLRSVSWSSSISGLPISLNKIAVDASWVTGQRAWDPPDPIPNSEVKPRSVCDISDVFGFAKSRKLAAHLSLHIKRLRFLPEIPDVT